MTLGCAVVYPNQAAQNILEAQGFNLVRYFQSLRIELEDKLVSQWPVGVTIRHKVPGRDEEMIYQAIDETFRDHWGYVAVPFAEGFKRFIQRDVQNNPHYDPTLWFIAIDGNELAGYAICRETQNQLARMGHIDKLGVRIPWRRRGLGLALLQHSLNEFYQRGIGEVRLEVDGDSPTGATRLYEKAGMSPYLQKAVYQKELRSGLR